MSAARANKAEEDSRKAIELWLNSHRKAVKTAGTSAGVTALKREASEKMADMPTATRGFFDDLYAERIKALKDIEAKEAQEALE